MQFCNFAARITAANEKDNLYSFEILDRDCFEINKKYFTMDNSEIEMFFIKDNLIHDIFIHGQNMKILKKKRLLFLDFCSAFVATNFTFYLKNKAAAQLSPGDVIFIRTNLLWKKN
jgi:hypothetical protein